MIITSITAEPHLVDEYDYTFSNGLFTTITVDSEAGDTVAPFDGGVTYHQAEKPSPTDPTTNLPAEQITIYDRHVVLVLHRRKLHTPTSPEERDEFRKTLFKLTGSVN